MLNLTKTQTLALAVSAGAIVFTAYKFYKTYKQVQESIIFTDDADLIRKTRERHIIEEEEEDDDIYYTVPLSASDLEVEVDPDDFYPTENLEEDEGGSVLMYDKNSEEAYSQFMDINLHLLEPMSPVRQMYEILFQIPYNPLNEGDKIRHRYLLEKRWLFFGGDSRYADEITWGELLIYYAERVDRQVGIPYPEVMSDILKYTGMTHTMPSHILDEVLEMLAHHDYVYNNTYGLFGLNDAEQMILDMRVNQTVANVVTFDLEFDVYMNRKVGEL